MLAILLLIDVHLDLMNEHSLHLAIKRWYSIPGDEFEVNINDFIVDIVRGNLLIEIQTKNFSSIRNKLKKLVEKWGGKGRDWRKMKGTDAQGRKWHWYQKRGDGRKYGIKPEGKPDPF